MIQTTNWEIGYYKDAISVIENVVYAHDAERKWIQNHPVVLYECYILNHIFQHLNNQLYEQPLDSDTIETQAKDKDAALKLMKCLIGFAEDYHLVHDFVIIEASQFSSGFAKPDFSKTPITFNSSSVDEIETDFETVAKPLQPNEQGRKKFYYLFYRRQNDSEEIDKAELCRRLAGQFAKPGTKKRVRHR